MTPSYQAQRVGIFIDVQNIYHSAKNLYHARVNFQELVKVALDKRSLVRAFAYVVKSDHTTGEDSFFDALRKTGLELRIKDLQIYPGGAKKADWDVGMAVDAIRLASSLDVIILITGDGDFIPLVEHIRFGMGRPVEVVAFSRTASGKLREIVDRFVEIENIPRILLKIKNQKTEEGSRRSTNIKQKRRTRRQQ